MLNQDKRISLRSRALPELDHTHVSTFPWSYVMTQTLMRTKLIQQPQANALFSAWYDRLTTPFAKEGDAFHFVSSMGLLAAKQARQHGVRLICDVRTAHVLEEETLLREEYQRLGLNYRSTRTTGLRKRILAEYELADDILVMSTYARESFIRQGFPSEKLHVLELGVNPQNFSLHSSHLRSKTDNVFRIIFVGQVLPRKGLHYLIDAFQQSNLPDSELLIFGSIGDKEYARRYLASTDIKVNYLGRVPPIELQRSYQIADVFVLPAISDGFAMVVSEAMAAGLPVIVSENTGASKLVREDQDGFVVPVRDVTSLQEKLIWLYDHPHERTLMGQQAIRRAEQFNWERYSKGLIQIYHRILSRSNCDE